MKEQAGELPLSQRVDGAITSTLVGYKKVGKTWMHTSGVDETSFSKAFTRQPSQNDKTRSYIALSFFVGKNPPKNSPKWTAMSHASFRFQHMPYVLEALGEEVPQDLPRDIVTKDNPDITLSDAEKIAQAAKVVFEKIKSPNDLLILTDHLEKIEPKLSRILGITTSGRQALGIS